MENKDTVIEHVTAFMALCSAITTNGASKPDSYQFEYQELRSQLMNTDGLQLPLWITASNTPASVLAHVKMERGSGTGTWKLRRDFFQQEKMKILSCLSSPPAHEEKSVRTSELSPWFIQPSGAFSPQAERQTEGSSVVRSPDNNQTPDPSHYQPVLPSPERKKKVFIVHGHDDELKLKVARLVDQQGFESIIFHEQRIGGTRTIIDKLVTLTKDVDFAVVLYTACDTGKSRSENVDQPRARQNVVFEHGFLLATLGQEKVMALKDPEVAAPSDLDGVLYISIDDDWKYALAEELKALS
ncbi:TIR domain-containing protein [Kosakonia sp. MUSA4]|uniref:TIR domain-containing protein n=1 Tax=Kosakonia sp. MUSA4 TaxID=2067958 RepID=UPI00159AB3D6|nr:nucleotide-binding protein [Kosakonia sp. MUSA4]QJT82323.1 hypothetical protein C0557_20710 [Kosakonia sp. MUSA4]